MKHKIFCYNNGGPSGFLTAIAMAEDGNVLAQHICSSEAFMLHDLGITSDWKHENYNAHYGEGNWELVWVKNPLDHEGLANAYAKNQLLAVKEEKANENSPVS